MSVALRLLLLVAVVSCGSKGAYQCTSDPQCVRGDVAGTCAMMGYCAFPDPACEGGFRYEDGAGGGLANTCTTSLIDAGVGDAPAEESLCITDVAFGRRFGCVLKMAGTVWCSGENTNGQLGFGLAGVKTATPMQVRDVSTNLIEDATAIATGRTHACALRAGGSVWCWGSNESGQLGNATNTQSAAAVQVLGMTGPLTGIAEIKAGFNHTCARSSAGQVLCWGANGEAQLGDGTMMGRSRAAPVLVAAMGAPFAGAVDLQVGASHACVRKANDEMWCWGKNNDGELGDGTNVHKLVPVQVGTAKHIATSLWSTCRVNTDTSISCSGWNRAAAFSLGVDEGFQQAGGDYLTPVKALESAGGTPVMGAAQVAMGAGMCALMTDGSVQCSGDGTYGQNGTGAPRRVLTPVKRGDGTPLTADRLVAKWPHVCARKATGAWECWGRGSEGEFGDGTFTNRGRPAPLRTSCP